MDKTLIKTSKFLSLILRHQPDLIGLALDPQGWVDIDTLLQAAHKAGRRELDRALLERVVRENDKQRFAISPDGRRIRASQGHSVPVDLALQPQVPPTHLYHGTVDRFLPAIRQQGLRPGSRHHVHLSPDRETAVKVGQRRGKPIVLTVRAGDMHRDGHTFYRSANGVWLTDHVPANYLIWDT